MNHLSIDRSLAMAHQIEHLHSAEAVDEAILLETETNRLVVIRFGHSAHDDCLRVDAAMSQPKLKPKPLVAPREAARCHLLGS